MLLAVPNVSEARDPILIERLADAAARVAGTGDAHSEAGLAAAALASAAAPGGAELLDVHSDPVHNRSVLTLAAGGRGVAAAALDSLAEAAIGAIDMNEHEGAHPCVGALDVAPVVWLDETGIEPARGEARAVAQAIAELGVPVFFYGELASAPERTERAFFRQGGLPRLRERMAGGLAADLGPAEPHPTAGATLVTARAPIAAFNMTLATKDGAAALEIAATLRESGGGLPGVRAIGIEMRDGTVQVSTNVHDPIEVPLAEVLERAQALASPRGLRVSSVEIVGLVPRAALIGFPSEIPLVGFDRDRGVIEARVAQR